MRITPYAGQQCRATSRQDSGSVPAGASDQGVREVAGGVSLSPVARLLARAQAEYAAGVAERGARVAGLKEQVRAGEYIVDRCELSEAILRVVPPEGGQ